METGGSSLGVLRRGSYDDAAVPLRPQFRNLAQRRRSAPSLVFGKGMGMPWSPIREESSCWVAADQSPFVLGLCGENGELQLDQKVQVTEGSKTKERHLFLFTDVLIFAKLKSVASYRLKQRVKLDEAWVFSFDPDLGNDISELDSKLELSLSLVLAWDLSVCLLTFSSPNEKECWLNILHRNICEAKALAGEERAPSDGLMKVLTGSIAVKSLSGGGMEHPNELPINGTVCVAQQQYPSTTTAEENTGSEKRWRGVVRRLKSGSSFVNRVSRPDTKKQLFGKPLSKVCPQEDALPKAILEMLMLLRKRGPSTEGVFRKSCNNKKMLEVREQLDSGAEVHLEEQPVVLLVGLLKSFLKELPGSLLDTQLYDKWMCALEWEDLQQRAEALQRVLEELPRPNMLLLQHLLCVLHHIQEKSHTNMMDSHNLAVCIGPTLLCLQSTPLEEQPDRMKRVADLTEFLMEHWEILGDNIPNLLEADEDSVSSQHHDSAYDSTDPDGDADHVDSSIGDTKIHSSFSSCCHSSTNHLYLIQEPSPLSTKAVFSRRCSEPIIVLSADSHGLQCHARSHDDCSVSTRVLAEQPLKKQTSDDAILSRRSSPFFPQNNIDALLCKPINRVRDCSCSSIDSATSNQSESSVFTCSPVGSPTCQRKAISVHSNHEKAEDKKRPQSIKVLLRARSFNRISLKRADPQSENSFPCETLQEDLQSEELSPKPRPLSAIEVFKYIDSRLPSEPPSYEQAIQSTHSRPAYNVMTVQDAIRLDRRSRPVSVNYEWPTCAQFPARKEVNTGRDEVDSERSTFRPRAMSECVSVGPPDTLLRRCSQPVFEDFSYAKESYV